MSTRRPCNGNFISLKLVWLGENIIIIWLEKKSEAFIAAIKNWYDLIFNKNSKRWRRFSYDLSVQSGE